MPGARDGVTTIEIEIALAVARIDPNTFTAFSDDRHLLVSRELIPLFERGNLFRTGYRCHRTYSPQRTQRRTDNI